MGTWTINVVLTFCWQRHEKWEGLGSKLMFIVGALKENSRNYFELLRKIFMKKTFETY